MSDDFGWGIAKKPAAQQLPFDEAGVVAELARERSHQTSLGFGADHDDLLEAQHWSWLLARRAVEVGSPIVEDDWRQRRMLVEIMAIAAAAIEAYDRRHSGKAPQ